MKSSSLSSLDSHQKNLVRLLELNVGQYRRREVFRDFCELAALAISNSADRRQFGSREARYLAIVKRYPREDVYRFREMLGELTASLDLDIKDSLGQLYMAMDLGDQSRGQFFTPDDLARLAARFTFSDPVGVIDRRGFITVCDVAAGSGSMLIGAAHTLGSDGIDVRKVLHVTAQDIDATAVHMTYVQLSLLGIPGVVLHGNSLSGETPKESWLTPSHILGSWSEKLARAAPGPVGPATTPPRTSRPLAVPEF